MAMFNNPMNFEAVAAISRYRLVTITSAGKVDLNGVGVSAFTGVALESVAAGSFVAVSDKKTPGSQTVIAAKAIAAIGTVLYAAASGKVSDAVSGTRIGVARTTAAADGDEIEVIFD